MLLGLALVLGLIYGLYRLLKRSSDKNEKVVRGGDDWMSVIASTRIAPSRSVHLIRVGEEIVLVGSGEQGVTPIRVYTAEEARRLRIEPNEPLVAGAGALADAPRGFVGTLLEQLRKKTAR
jgi:flagellar protein FliO/FliZ